MATLREAMLIHGGTVTEGLEPECGTLGEVVVTGPGLI